MPGAECNGLIPGIFASLGLTLSLLAGFWCKNFKFTPVAVPEGVDDPDIHMGAWYQQTTTINTGSINGEYYIWTEKFCVDFWVAPELDAYWKASRAFSIIAATIGGLGTIALCFSCCFPERFTTDLWRSLALKFSVLVTLSQGLSLLIFKSTACTDNNIIKALETSVGGLNIYNNTCVWDKGSSINVSALCSWFVTGLAMILIGPPVPFGDVPPRDEPTSRRRWFRKPKKSADDAAASATPENDQADAPETADEAGASAAAPQAVTE